MDVPLSSAILSCGRKWLSLAIFRLSSPLFGVNPAAVFLGPAACASIHFDRTFVPSAPDGKRGSCMNDAGSDEWYADAFDEHYLDLYSYRDVEEAALFTGVIAEQVSLRGALVLDLACGAGRYMETLRDAGAMTVGLDLSPALLARASDSGGGPLVRGDMRRLPFGAGVFDGVISMFTSFGYFPEIADEMAVLKGVARCLKASGWFVIDYMNSAEVRRSLEPSSSRRAGDLTAREKRRIEEDGERVVKEVSLYDGDRLVKEYTEIVRLLSAEELKKMLAGAGLGVLRLMGDYHGGAFDEGASPRMIAYCRKR
jgi:SAM-dependent methyltransferase